MTKTLDGKTAGLQDARALREETESHKRREVEQFNKVTFFIQSIFIEVRVSFICGSNCLFMEVETVRERRDRQ